MRSNHLLLIKEDTPTHAKPLSPNWFLILQLARRLSALRIHRPASETTTSTSTSHHPLKKGKIQKDQWGSKGWFNEVYSFALWSLQYPINMYGCILVLGLTHSVALNTHDMTWRRIHQWYMYRIHRIKENLLPHLIQYLKMVAQIWEKLLHYSGTAHNIKNCFGMHSSGHGKRVAHILYLFLFQIPNSA